MQYFPHAALFLLIIVLALFLLAIVLVFWKVYNCVLVTLCVGRQYFRVFLHVCASFCTWASFQDICIAVLEDGDSDFLQGRGHICFLTRIMKTVSLSVLRFGQVFHQPTGKDWDFLNCGFLSFDMNLLYVQPPPVPFSASPVESWGHEKNEKLLLPVAKILFFCLSLRSLSSPASFYETVAG